MSQLKVDTITDEAGTGSPSLPNGLTVGGVNYPTTGPLSNRNKIINGAMVIDQRNAGAAVTAPGFPVDRFQVTNTTGGTFSAQQDSIAPIGFVTSLKCTTTAAAASLTGTQTCVVLHLIEGFNISDFGWGTANATPITLSFWVRSSLTGTFGGSLRNSVPDRSYPFTYTINAANTWEQKTVTVPGDTTGTWLTTNSIGLTVTFSMGAGPDRSGTSGAWNSNNNVSATGAVSVIGTLNATWQVTGVQLEAGTVATPFEHRSFGQELALCQRYGFIVPRGTFGRAGSTTQIVFFPSFNMRAAPTASLISGSIVADDGSTSTTAASPTIGGISAGENGARVFIAGFSGLTTGAVFPISSGNRIFLSAEL
jgi:hypothetical protein